MYNVLMHNVLPLFNYDNPSRLLLTPSVSSGVDSSANNTASKTASEAAPKSPACTVPSEVSASVAINRILFSFILFV
jgi:hypothetical protein